MNWLFENIVASIIQSITTLALGWIMYQLYTKHHYSGWKVIVKRGDTVLNEREIGSRKAAEILDDQYWMQP